MSTLVAVAEPVLGTDARADVVATRPMMGGRVAIALRDGHGHREPDHAANAVLDRIAGWAGRLTRFDDASELSRLNAARGRMVEIGPTLTGVLDWARIAEGLTDGLVDVAMLDERVAAERGASSSGDQASYPGAARRWSLTRRARGAVLNREPGVRFDLDGVAKGWLADRALALTPGRSALVDGDGDVAIRVAPGESWEVGIADPGGADALLGVVTLRATAGRTARFGLATSGTSVHRWSHGAGAGHHIIDPRTRRPAATDVVQATVLADSARAAEAFAKVAVIVGSTRAFERLDRPDVHGLLVLTDAGGVKASQEMARWLA